jgi:putative FmdB family regulatory protein
MPVYDFECAGCGDFSVLKPLAKRNDPQACPSCGETAARQLIAAPAFASMPAASRNAAAINEKSRHEPKLSGAHQCGAHCTHTASASASGPKSFPQKRPWMISH